MLKNISLTKIDSHKKAMVDAMTNNLGNVTNACKEVGISRQTHYNYYNDDPEYKKVIDDIGEIVLDFAEQMLQEKIRDKDTTAIIFFLKTRGKKRGYIERAEQSLIFDTPPIIKLLKGNGD